MDTKQFKTLFNGIAKISGFEFLYGGWFKEDKECIVTLDLQKSNYSNLFYLNIKIYIQGMFGNKYSKSKDLVCKDIGDFFTRQPNEYSLFFDLENPISEEERTKGLKQLFEEYVNPLSESALTFEGVKELSDNSKICLLPAVKKELNSIISSKKCGEKESG